MRRRCYDLQKTHVQILYLGMGKRSIQRTAARVITTLDTGFPPEDVEILLVPNRRGAIVPEH